MGESAAEVDQIEIKVDTGSDNYLDLFINPNSTFADLKSVIAKETGLKPEEQKLLFRGKEMDDHEQLHMAGVKGNAKVILIENLPTKNEDFENVDKTEEVKENVEEVKETIKEVSRGVEAVNKIREENNQFAEQVASLEAVVCSGIQVADKDFVFLTEMLMRQLLKLDGIDAEGEGRTQRKLETRFYSSPETVCFLPELDTRYSSQINHPERCAVFRDLWIHWITLGQRMPIQVVMPRNQLLVKFRCLLLYDGYSRTGSI